MCENAHATCRCDDLAPLLIVDLDCDKQKKAENAFDVFKHQDDTHDMNLHEAFKEICAVWLTMVATGISSEMRTKLRDWAVWQGKGRLLLSGSIVLI